MQKVKGKVWLFGDHVDTDQIIPAERLTSDNNDKSGDVRLREGKAGHGDRW